MVIADSPSVQRCKHFGSAAFPILKALQYKLFRKLIILFIDFDSRRTVFRRTGIQWAYRWRKTVPDPGLFTSVPSIGVTTYDNSTCGQVFRNSSPRTSYTNPTRKRGDFRFILAGALARRVSE